jgi:prephenate dehydrogenase
MSTNEDPPFRKIAIVGLGLIGGSIALGVKERWPSVRVLGVDRHSVIAHALGSGAIDRGFGDSSALGEADLVVLAAPVRQNLVLLAEMAPRLPATAVVTDVGGTKRDIVRVAQRLPLSAVFVGGHPIGGAERGGFGFARPDLFKGRPWIFTPADRAATDTIERLFTFVKGFGARPSTLDAADHDRAMAFLSHLPQLAATALMEVIGAAVHGDGLSLAGRGLVDTTRLASSPPDTWVDICATNADRIEEALDALIARLSDIRADLRGGGAVNRIFDEAARWRIELMKGRD